MSSCDMDDKITLDDHKVSRQNLFITCDTFYLTPFLVNWFGWDLVMDDHHGWMEFYSVHHQNKNQLCVCVCVYIYIYICIYIYIYIERERERERELSGFYLYYCY